MKSFTEFILQEQAHTGHLTHIEDLLLYGGVDGTREAITTLRAVRDTLKSSAKSKFDINFKADGAPAVWAGPDPEDGRFFVAKKSIFNKVPKVYKSVEDVKADTSGDLQEKMVVAFEEFSKLGLKTIIQGDLMFTSDKKVQTIDGKKYITFHPNTIVYAVSMDSDIAKQIVDAKIGVIWHTEWSGPSLSQLSSKNFTKSSTLPQIRSVWMMDNNIKDLSGSVTFTKKEYEAFTKLLSRAGALFNKINSGVLKTISQESTYARDLETFNNTFVRKGEQVKNTKKHVQGLIKWATERFNRKIDKLKSEKGKAKHTALRDEYLKFFSKENQAQLKLLYDLQNTLIEAKLMAIKKMDEIEQFGTFVRTKDGFRATGHEGFVVVDKGSGKTLKLVDRLEFSHNNFNPDILKGWQ
jgi:hypothetical protein